MVIAHKVLKNAKDFPNVLQKIEIIMLDKVSYSREKVVILEKLLDDSFYELFL